MKINDGPLCKEKEYLEESEEEVEVQEDKSDNYSETPTAESTEDFETKDDDDSLTLLQELQLFNQDSREIDYYFPADSSRRRFIFEKSHNFLLLKEEITKFQQEPIWMVIDDSDSCGERIPIPTTTTASLQEPVKPEEHEEQRHSRSVFTNKNMLVAENKSIKDYAEEEEEDNKARVYWASAGLIKEKPAPSLLRVDEIPDSARPTLAKLTSKELLEISTQHASITSMVMERGNLRHKQPFGLRTESNKICKKTSHKKGFVKFWANFWQNVKKKMKRSR
ncbi:uncharacterized protein isoform X2 [Rhodnius prolixus]